MEQVDGDLFTYSVGLQEIVTLAVKPIGVGNFASVNINGTPQARALSYQLTAAGPSGREHDVVMEFEFPGISDPQARYEVELTSDRGSGPFTFSVKNSNTLKEAALTFTVV